MESPTTARARLSARRQELLAELEQVQRKLEQLDTTVVVSQWWQAPSGPMGRGTVYHAQTAERCRPQNSPDGITLYEALEAGLTPCGRCRSRPGPGRASTGRSSQPSRVRTRRCPGH